MPELWVDHDRLEQVLVNLIDNALRHGPPGGPVQVVASADGDNVTIRVIDDGPGFTAELAARVFQPYVRGDTGTPAPASASRSVAGSSRPTAATSPWSPPAAGACVPRRHPRRTPAPDADTALDHVPG